MKARGVPGLDAGPVAEDVVHAVAEDELDALDSVDLHRERRAEGLALRVRLEATHDAVVPRVLEDVAAVEEGLDDHLVVEQVQRHAVAGVSNRSRKNSSGVSAQSRTPKLGCTVRMSAKASSPMVLSAQVASFPSRPIPPTVTFWVVLPSVPSPPGMNASSRMFQISLVLRKSSDSSSRACSE